MFILGINAAFHDSAACLVRDGQVIAAAEEERFTRIKHGKRPFPFSTYELPFEAIAYCLREAGITLEEVEHVAYSFDPQLLLSESNQTRISLPLEPSATAVEESENAQSPWEPLFLSSIINAPRHLLGGVPHHLQLSFHALNKPPDYRWHFVAHHLSHAASAYLPSPFSEAAVMVIDGRGELATGSYWKGQGGNLELLDEVHLPHSLGLLYERVTEHLGFLHSSDEYKVMALASFGTPKYLRRLNEGLQLTEGRYTLNLPEPAELFGPARKRGELLERQHADIAASLQTFLEDTVVEISKWLYRESGSSQLCLAGGVALNCVMNSEIRDRTPFKEIWVQPAAGDAGTALGAALQVAEEQGGSLRKYRMKHAYLGPSYDRPAIEKLLKHSKQQYREVDDIARETAKLLEEDRIIGWFQGRMEFGPRALGARSILASPLRAEMQERLNVLKGREEFRPVAPLVLEEEAGEWFVHGGRSPFMLFTTSVQPEKAERIPAALHHDKTARIQTVAERDNPLLFELLRAFKRRTGVPVLINTSFNSRTKPIVCSPQDALECFWTSSMDALVIGPFLLEKEPRR